jgi:16S rRNA (cytidine1402-2'-O)-methyltransferase
MHGTLYVVATPIGTLADLSPRAAEVLSSVDLVLAEDTRSLKKLLPDRSLKSLAYHARNARLVRDRILSLLEEGKTLALTTDAGTPGVSDPGVELVAFIRERAPETRILSVPGPSALAAALAVSGLPTAPMTFLGFPPHKKGRQTFFRELAELPHTAVFYESPHRLLKALESLAEVLPASARVVVLRELSKRHEGAVSGSPSEVLAHFLAHAEEVRGEIVVVVSPAS